MVDKENNNWEYFEGELESDDLSLCNFSMQDNKESSVMESPRNSSAEEFFEFFTTEMIPSSYTAPDIIFCGKIIHEDQDNKPNEYQKRDYLAMARSRSFGRPPPAGYCEYPCLNYNEEKDVFAVKACSSSLRSSQPTKHSANYNQIQKVNITSLTSMSAKSRRRMFMFGPVKFKPEMELSALKERQSRRIPTMVVPVPVVVSGGKPRRKSQWGKMMRSLRGRSNLTNVLAKSLGCISPGRGMEKWIRVAS